jgi:hypothetical protein
MRCTIAVRTAGAGAFLSALLFGADATTPCRLGRSLFDDRLAIERQVLAEGPATGALLAPGTAGLAPAGKLAAIDEEYRQFLAELSHTKVSHDGAALQTCCDQASSDRAGALFCQLVTYLNSRRTESNAFLKAFPSSKKDISMLWTLDAISAGQGKNLFPPRGPSYGLIDELFLLVLDEREQAISKYFNLSARATAEKARYMDDQIKLFLRESQFVVVDRWPLLRRYKPKLTSVFQTIVSESSHAEMQKIARAVRTFCERGNADCHEVRKLYGVE